MSSIIDTAGQLVALNTQHSTLNSTALKHREVVLSWRSNALTATVFTILEERKEGRWECYSKYVEQNCFSYFLSMQCTNMGHPAIVLQFVALSDDHKAMVARRHLLFHWMRRKHLIQFSSRYLE